VIAPMDRLHNWWWCQWCRHGSTWFQRLHPASVAKAATVRRARDDAVGEYWQLGGHLADSTLLLRPSFGAEISGFNGCSSGTGFRVECA
jgi:hypothetical protein